MQKPLPIHDWIPNFKRGCFRIVDSKRMLFRFVDSQHKSNSLFQQGGPIWFAFPRTCSIHCFNKGAPKHVSIILFAFLIIPYMLCVTLYLHLYLHCNNKCKTPLPTHDWIPSFKTNCFWIVDSIRNCFLFFDQQHMLHSLFEHRDPDLFFFLTKHVPFIFFVFNKGIPNHVSVIRFCIPY